MYYSLIADIKNSKKINNRSIFQNKLNDILDRINNSYDDSVIASKFVITTGDEFQCLFYKPDKIFEIITKIELAMYPVKLRFAIGYGKIITNINKEQAIGSDGPVWWRAREGIESLRETQEKGIKENSNIKIVGLSNKSILEIVNMCLVLIVKIKDKWTPRQRDLILKIINNNGLEYNVKQTVIAVQTGLQADVVNKRLKSSNYFDFAMAYEKIVKVIKEDTKVVTA